MKRIAILMIGAAIVSGCASKDVVTHIDTIEVQNKETQMKRTSRDSTLSWENIGRGGAALRQPAYVHVLGEGNLKVLSKDSDIPEVNAKNPFEPSDLMAVIDGIDKKSSNATNQTKHSIKQYSLYELSRWERFCDQGKGMDEDDWMFVTNNGGESGLPEIYSGSCKSPGHNYADYLDAWVEFCSNDSIERHQRDIVRDSVRPKTKVNPCKKLNLQTK
ncbi:hypothetical protein [Marinomonas algarum]|uniref:Lipoprotein n=1 Tax=Marinomonas algarum TaxID=2883105 RepID=A0A9X1IQH4_9GAMM|nr:hypothetical protein [Marinomonas algarum]MCB5162636.1 hypothetical protein [Marinomonas algarum]